VVFSTTEAVIPDVVWISQDRLAYGIDDAGHHFQLSVANIFR